VICSVILGSLIALYEWNMVRHYFPGALRSELIVLLVAFSITLTGIAQRHR
jgi:hypothetical protein